MSDKFTIRKCKNCKTKRYPIRSRKLCSRCYPLVLKQEKALKWEIKDKKSLQKCPIAFFAYNPKKFFEYKNAYLEIIDNRLEYLAYVETILTGSTVSGIQIEYQLERIAERAGLRDAKLLTHSWASSIDSNINKKGKHFLFCRLNDIEEKFPWYGLSLGHIVVYAENKQKYNNTP